MAHTSSSQNESTLQWLRFFKELSLKQAGALLKTEQYAWYLSLDNWPEHNPYLTFSDGWAEDANTRATLSAERTANFGGIAQNSGTNGVESADQTAVQNVNKAADHHGGAGRLIFKVDKPRLSACPSPSDSLKAWLEPGWNDGQSEVRCYLYKLELNLPVDSTLVDKLQAPAELTEREYLVLLGKGSYVAAPYKSVMAADYQPPQIANLSCIRYTSNQEWVDNLQSSSVSSTAPTGSSAASTISSAVPAGSAVSSSADSAASSAAILASNNLVLSCTPFNEDKALATWTRLRQAWQQARISELAALEIYQRLQSAYALYTQASGELELCLTNGLLRALDESRRAQFTLACTKSSLTDSSQTNQAQSQTQAQANSALSQQDGAVLSLDGQAQIQDWPVQNQELVPSAQKTERVDKAEGALKSEAQRKAAALMEIPNESNKSEESLQEALEQALGVVHPLILRPVRLEFNERLEQFKLYTLEAPSELYQPALYAAVRLGLGSIELDPVLTKISAEVAALFPLERNSVLRVLEQLGTQLTKCLVTSNLTHDLSLWHNYSSMLALAPGLLLRATTVPVSASINALEDYVQRGGLLSAPAYTLLGLPVPQAVLEKSSLYSEGHMEALVSTDSRVASGAEVKVGADSGLKSGSSLDLNGEANLGAGAGLGVELDTGKGLGELGADNKFVRLGAERLEVVLTRPLNAQQQVVLSAQPVVSVKAPVGTGKSYTAASLIGLALAQNQRILVTSSRQDVLQAVFNALDPTLRGFCYFPGQVSELPHSFKLKTVKEQINALRVERVQVFQQLLAKRHKLFNWLNFGNTIVEYQGEQYTCDQLDNFVKEHESLAKLIPFTPQLDSNPQRAETFSSSNLCAESNAQSNASAHDAAQGALEQDPTQCAPAQTQSVVQGVVQDQNLAQTQGSAQVLAEDGLADEMDERGPGNFRLQALPLSLEELQALYATNESVPVQYEELLKRDWPNLRYLPQPAQFLDLLQVLSKLQQGLDHATSWQLDLNLAQDAVTFRPRIAPAQALFGSKVVVQFSKFQAEAASCLLMGQISTIPNWISTVFTAGTDPQSPIFGRWFQLAQCLMQLQSLHMQVNSKLENHKLELHPQCVQNLSQLKQLESAITYVLKAQASSAASSSLAENTGADPENKVSASAQDGGKLQQAYGLVERLVRLDRQAVHGTNALALVLDYVRLQQLKLQSLGRWQELVLPLGGESLKDTVAVWDETGRLGYLMHWVLHWTSNRALLLETWQKKFNAVGCQCELNLQDSDLKTHNLQRAVIVFSALQRIGQELVWLSQQVLRYYRYCRRYNQAVKLLNQDKFKANPACALLLQALVQRQPPLYAKAYRQIQQILEYKSAYQQRCELLGRLETVAPEWAEAIFHRQSEHGKATVSPDILKAWQYWQFAQCLAQLTSNSQSKLSQQLTPLKTKFYAVSAQYVEKLATLNLLTSSLSSSNNVLAVMAKFRAQPELVPVFIMPWADVMARLASSKLRFDILVVDEAQRLPFSALALLLFNLASKVVLLDTPERLGTPHKLGQVKLTKPLQAQDKVPQLNLDNSLDEVKAPDGRILSLYAPVSDCLELPRYAWKEQFVTTSRLLSWLNRAPSMGAEVAGTKVDASFDVGADTEVRTSTEAGVGLENSDCTVSSAGMEPVSGAVAMAVSGAGSGRLIGRRLPQLTALQPECLLVNAPEQALDVVVALLQACDEQTEYASKTFGVMVSDALVETLGRRLLGALSLSLCQHHQLRYGSALAFTGACCDVMFLILDECGNADLALTHTAEQIWVINTLNVQALPQNAPELQFLAYVEQTQNDFATLSFDLQKMEAQLQRALVKVSGLIESKRQFLQSLVHGLSERGFQLQLSEDEPWALIVLYQQRRLRLECHLESELSHPDSVFEIIERHEQCEQAGLSVLHVLCSPLATNVLESLVQQLQREGFYPENLRGFVQVLVHQSAVVLLHKLQKRLSSLLQESGSKLQVNLWDGTSSLTQGADSGTAGIPCAQDLSGAQAGQTTETANTDKTTKTDNQGLPSDAQGHQSSNASNLENKPGAQTDRVGANGAQAKESGAMWTQADGDNPYASDEVAGYASYVAPNAAQQDELTSELERVMTQQEKAQASAAYEASGAAQANTQTQANGQAKDNGQGQGNDLATNAQAEVDTSQYNYLLARLGIRKIAQPLPEFLPEDNHERFRVFKRFLFGMLKQLRLSYIDLLSSYQIIAVTPGTGQTQVFLRLCELLRLRPYIYSASKPMAKRVWCIRQSDLMSPYALEAAVALCKGQGAAGQAGNESAFDNGSQSVNEENSANTVDDQRAQRNAYGQSGVGRDGAHGNYRARIPQMAAGDDNSPLVAALNRALNPYWGQSAAEPVQVGQASTMQSISRRMQQQTWEPPRSTNQFLREQLLPPPMRRNLNRDDVNTLAVLSMIPKQQALPVAPSKARLHTLRVTNGSNKSSATTSASSPARSSGSASARAFATSSARADNDNTLQQENTQLERAVRASASDSRQTTSARMGLNQETRTGTGAGTVTGTRSGASLNSRESEAQDKHTQNNEYLNMSDSSLQEAAKQLEETHRKAGEFTLSPIFKLPEVSQALNSSLATASDLMKDNRSYPVYGAGAAANVRVKRTGAVDYPGMPADKARHDAGAAAPNDLSKNLESGLGKAQTQAQGYAPAANGQVSGGAQGQVSGQGVVHGQTQSNQPSSAAQAWPGVNRERFNADAAVAELLMRLDSQADSQNASTGMALAQAGAGMGTGAAKIRAGSETGIETGVDGSKGQTANANVMVKGSIMGIGEIDGEWAGSETPGPAMDSNLVPTMDSTRAATTASGMAASTMGAQAPNSAVARNNLRGLGMVSRHNAGVLANRAAQGLSLPKNTMNSKNNYVGGMAGDMFGGMTNGVVGENASGMSSSMSSSLSQGVNGGRGAGLSHATGHQSMDKSAYPAVQTASLAGAQNLSQGAYGYASTASATTNLSAEQINQLAMLLKKNGISFTQGGNALLVKVFLHQENTFFDLCRTMRVAPKHVVIGKNDASFTHWRIN